MSNPTAPTRRWGHKGTAADGSKGEDAGSPEKQQSEPAKWQRNDKWEGWDSWWGDRGQNWKNSGEGWSSKGPGDSSRKGQGKANRNGQGYGGTQNWDAAQLKKLEEGSKLDPSTLGNPRPQRPVEAFPHLTVAADWPERRAPRSGSSFYLPLIWSALLLDDDRKEEDSPPWQVFNKLGDAKHFHNGRVRRSTRDELMAAQPFWRQVFSGWDDWVVRLRSEMDKLGRDGYATETIRFTSVTACALIYGDLEVLGAMPHISNARQHGTQDAIMELDFCLRLEIEASIATLFLPGGEAFRASAPASAPKALPKAVAKPAATPPPLPKGPSEGPAQSSCSRSEASPTASGTAPSTLLVVPTIEHPVDGPVLAQWCEACAAVFQSDGARLRPEDVAREFPAFASTLKSSATNAPESCKATIKEVFAQIWNFRGNEPVAEGEQATANSIEAAFRELARRLRLLSPAAAGAAK